MTDDGREPIEPIMPEGLEGTVSEHVLEMPDPDPNADKRPGVGALDEDSEYHPNFVNPSVSPTPKLQQAYDCLQIKTPIEEFHTYAGSRLEALVRLGEPDRAEVTSRALELGIQALRQVMGAVPSEAP